jgi:transposase
MHRWSFDRLFGFIAYKGQLAGLKVEKIDPRHTSQRCSKCGDTRKSNRMSQNRFECHACLLSLNADLNGARNIALKLAVAGMPATVGRPSTGPMSPVS